MQPSSQEISQYPLQKEKQLLYIFTAVTITDASFPPPLPASTQTSHPFPLTMPTLLSVSVHICPLANVFTPSFLQSPLTAVIQFHVSVAQVILFNRFHI